MERPPESRTTVAVIAFAVAFVASAIGVVWLLFGFVTDFAFACLFASFLAPFYRTMLSRLGHRPWAAAGIAVSILVVVIAVTATFIVTSLSHEAASAYQVTKQSVTMDNLERHLFGDSMFAQTAKRLAQTVGVEYTPQSVRALITGVFGAVASFLYTQVNALLSNLVGFLFHFAIMVLFVFYLLIDGERLKRFLFRLSPLPEEDEELIADKFKAVGRAIVFGNGISSITQGVLGATAMSLAGIPSPVLWGTVMTVSAFLPLVGISAVVIPAAISLFLADHTLAGIVFLAFTSGMGLFVENVVKVRLIGSHMKMHDVLIFVSILAGLGLFGVTGLLYGPLIVALFLTMSELYERHYRPRILAALEVVAIRVPSHESGNDRENAEPR